MASAGQAMPELSARELRRFGLSVGGAFAVLGLISWWRGHEIPPMVLGTLAVALFVPGLFAPRALRGVQRRWMHGAMVVGEFNSRLILGVFYYLVMAPIGFIRRLFGDPLNRQLGDRTTTVWVKRERTPVDRERYERQF
jgi:uncharacterized membrane protein